MKMYLEKIVDLARVAYNNDDIPVGAIVIYKNKIIGEGFNTRNSFKSVIGHAEINAIEMASKYIGDWRLDDCIMYVTLLPCMMCAGAIVDSRIKKVYYLCERTNVCFNSKNYFDVQKIDDEMFENKYMEMLQSFFENKRNKS